MGITKKSKSKVKKTSSQTSTQISTQTSSQISTQTSSQISSQTSSQISTQTKFKVERGFSESLREAIEEKMDIKTIELTTTLHMLWGYWKNKDINQWSIKSYLYEAYSVIKSFLEILPCFFNDNEIMVKLFLIEYSMYITDIRLIDDHDIKMNIIIPYYFLLCDCIFSGNIDKFFDGLYGRNISYEISGNTILINTISSIVKELQKNCHIENLDFGKKFNYQMKLHNSKNILKIF